MTFSPYKCLIYLFWEGVGGEFKCSCTILRCDLHYYSYLLDTCYSVSLGNIDIPNIKKIQADVTSVSISPSSAFTLV